MHLEWLASILLFFNIWNRVNTKSLLQEWFVFEGWHALQIDSRHRCESDCLFVCHDLYVLFRVEVFFFYVSVSKALDLRLRPLQLLQLSLLERCSTIELSLFFRLLMALVSDDQGIQLLIWLHTKKLILLPLSKLKQLFNLFLLLHVRLLLLLL